MAQSLRQIKQLLADHGLRPKKRYGQNFLHDQNQMRRIVEATSIRRGDLVLEVGAGTGALSELLIERSARLVAVEIDRDLEPILRARLADRARLYFGDVLAGKHAVAAGVLHLLGSGPFKLVANLPYHVASALLANLAAQHRDMTMAWVLVQREVADRLTAGPGGKDRGPLGILVQAMCEVRRLFDVSPSCFWPVPQVQSALVCLERRREPLTEDPDALSACLQVLFSKRRKQLRSIVGPGVALPEGVAADARPETMSVQQIEQLSRILEGST